MSNHYHLVLRLNPGESDAWTETEVLERWTALFKGPLLVQKATTGEALSGVEREAVSAITKIYRQRLGCLSWFMKCLNEPIARKANAEDDCTGHFWESRFQSQALMTDRALMTAMAYVDLNPIRSKLAATPEDSDYTSIQVRLRESDSPLRATITELLESGELRHGHIPLRSLMSFATLNTSSDHDAPCLPMYETEYVSLVDQTGRIAVADKSGRIDTGLAPLLERLGMTAGQWLTGATMFESYYRKGDLRLAKTA